MKYARLDNWPEDIMPIIQAFEAKRFPERGREVSPLVIWALRTYESLAYLEAIIRADMTNEDFVGSHRSEIKDIAHVRWSTGTAITCLDLCGAAIGREYGLYKGKRDLDLRNLTILDKANLSDRGRDDLERLRSKISPIMLEWVDEVSLDGKYKQVLSYRKPLTHSRVFVKRFLGVANNWTEFHVEPKTPAEDPDTLTVIGVVNLSKNLVRPHLERFVDLLPQL